MWRGRVLNHGKECFKAAFVDFAVLADLDFFRCVSYFCFHKFVSSSCANLSCSSTWKYNTFTTTVFISMREESDRASRQTVTKSTIFDNLSDTSNRLVSRLHPSKSRCISSSPEVSQSSSTSLLGVPSE